MKRVHAVQLLAIMLVVLAGGSVAVAKSATRTTKPTPRGHANGRTATTTLATTTTTRSATTTTTTTAPPPTTTTTRAPATTTTTVNAPATTPTTVSVGCVGTPMVYGQADIDAQPPGTTFCLTGTHNWKLNPKSGDTFIGPATLDGGGSTLAAFVGSAKNVTITKLTLQHYNGGDQQGAIHADTDLATGWTLNNVDVGFNNNVGVEPMTGMHINGGRFHDNGQEGLGGSVGDGVVVDGAEIDHNNTHHVSCGYEAGGFKWVADNVTVTRSRIHDNACKGLWTDINANGIVITDNYVYNNSDEGIFIEISSNATISGNTVYGNGWRNYNGDGSGCPWLFGGGITLNSSDHVDIFNNTVYDNCNGITAVQQDRPDGSPGLLQYVSVHDNSVAGPSGVTGAAEDNGANLGTRSITFTNLVLTNGMTYCGLSC